MKPNHDIEAVKSIGDVENQSRQFF
jgi:hypothetical protein